MMNLKIYISLFVIVFILIGCTKKPTHIDLEISSSKEVNYDQDKVSSPLMLVFYELSSADKFSKYEYWDIIDDKDNKLKLDVISQSKFIILPNELQTYKIVFDENTKYLGIIAKFSDIKDAKWRHIIDLEKDTYNESELKIKKYSIVEED